MITSLVQPTKCEWRALPANGWAGEPTINVRKGGGERSCVRKSAKVGSIRAERNSSKAGSLNGEGEGAGRKVRWSTGSRTIWG